MATKQDIDDAYREYGILLEEERVRSKKRMQMVWAACFVLTLVICTAFFVIPDMFRTGIACSLGIVGLIIWGYLTNSMNESAVPAKWQTLLKDYLEEIKVDVASMEPSFEKGLSYVNPGARGMDTVHLFEGNATVDGQEDAELGMHFIKGQIDVRINEFFVADDLS
jgi:hypothetical protein